MKGWEDVTEDEKSWCTFERNDWWVSRYWLARLGLEFAMLTGDLDPKWQGMDAPMVLVAKTLTKSDTLGRIILPRIAVETSMSFLTTARQDFSMLSEFFHRKICLPIVLSDSWELQFCSLLTAAFYYQKPEAMIQSYIWWHFLRVTARETCKYWRDWLGFSCHENFHTAH